MRFDVITLFPEMFSSVMGESILKRAVEKNQIDIHFWNPREYATDPHRTVDDTPYGGGPGMILKAPPIIFALRDIERLPRSKTILLAAKGKRFVQSSAQEMSRDLDQIIFVCGRYEGIDERVREYVDEEISIGDFVLTGGELPAMTIIDAVTRLIPGVLGDDTSIQDESHSVPEYTEYPQYTRPRLFETHAVPEVLLSGNHQKIEEWRDVMSSQKKKD